MKTKTHSALLKAPKSAVFAYLSKVENLPRWATAFCKGLRKSGGDYYVQTASGEMYFRIDADRETGVLDMVSGPAKDSTLTWPARAVELPDGNTLFLMTAIQTPGLSDEEFAGQSAEVERELANIRREVESRKAA